MNNKIKIEPLAFLKWLVMSLVGVLLWQTFSVQVLNREVYQTKAKNMVTSTRNVYADRGRIMDRNGVVLADNYRDTTNKMLDYTRIFLLMAIMGIMGWTGVARVVRGQILSLEAERY